MDILQCALYQNLCWSYPDQQSASAGQLHGVKTGSGDPSDLHKTRSSFLTPASWAPAFTAITRQLSRGGRLNKAPLRDTNQVEKFPVRLITGAVIAKEICLGGKIFLKKIKNKKYCCFVVFATPLSKVPEFLFRLWVWSLFAFFFPGLITKIH